MRLWEINLSKNDGTPIAFDKLWAFSALLKEVNMMNCPYCGAEMKKGTLSSCVLQVLSVPLLNLQSPDRR